MTAEYNRHGLQFLYPENWVLVDEQLDGVPRSVTVQSPSSAFWSVDIYPFSADQDAILGQTLDTMREEYEEVEVVEAQEQVCGKDAHGFDLMFWCLDFAVACTIRIFHHGHATFALTYQAEAREFEDLEGGFRRHFHEPVERATDPRRRIDDVVLRAITNACHPVRTAGAPSYAPPLAAHGRKSP